MNKLFVPYELALLAKEKGFDEECLGFYRIPLNEIKFEFTKTGIINSTLDKVYDKACAAPLYQQLIDWFREKHNLFIKIDNFLTGENIVTYDYCISYCDADIDERGNMQYLIDYDINRTFNYYEAMSKAIEEAFKLI